MTKIIMLGTGAGGAIELYNTCFVIQNEMGNFLIDAGGSMEIVKRLQQVSVEIKDIKNIFISHSHTDHILGLIWLFKKLGVMALQGKVTETINIYCNDVVYEAINGIARYTLPDELIKALYKVCRFIVLRDGEKHMVNDVPYTFFDVLARGTKQFGFECMLDKNRFVFLGDATLNPKLRESVQGADYVMHEAFCLDSEESKFHAYEKKHSTVLSAARTMDELDVQNLILYHTEESHIKERKQLYTEEAKGVFSGNVIVPDDLEVIQLVRKKDK